MKIPEYNRGWIDGVRFAITFIHRRALEMNDQSAKAALNTTAFHLGLDAKEHKLSAKIDSLESALDGAPEQSAQSKGN
jgi:hypothetical protein